MQNFIKQVLILSLLAFVFFNPILAQDSEPLVEADPVIVVQRDAYQIDVNTTQTIPYSILLEEPYKTIVTSSNTDVVVAELLNGELTITGKAAGNATVTLLVRVDNKEEHYTQDFSITVLPLTGTITFKENTFYLIRDLYYDIEFEISPSTIHESNVVWRSSNPDVATVVNGRVTGLKIGKTTITATLDNHVETMELFVTVPLKKMEFNPDKIVLEIDETRNIPQIIYVPYDTTTQKNIKYTVSDNSIVQLEDGIITGLKEGETSIIAKVNDIEAKLEVTVKRKATTSEIQTISLDVYNEGSAGLHLTLHQDTYYNNNRYDLELPVASIATYMDLYETSHIYISLPSAMMRDNFSYFNQIVVPSELLGKLESEQYLVIHLVDMEMNPKIQFIFNEKSDKDAILSFNFIEVLTTNSIYQYIKQPGAYSLSLKYPLEHHFKMGIHADYIESAKDQLVFVYDYKQNQVFESQSPVEVNDHEMVIFDVTSRHLILSLRPIGKAQGFWHLYVLGIPVLFIFVYIGWKHKNKMSKKA